MDSLLIMPSLWAGQEVHLVVAERVPDPAGHTELTYSIQAFDVLRSGACPPEFATALLTGRVRHRPPHQHHRGLHRPEAVLTGLAGIRPHPDGSLHRHSQPVAAGTITLQGLRYRDHAIDVVIAPDHTEIRLDGKPVGPGRIIPPR